MPAWNQSVGLVLFLLACLPAGPAWPAAPATPQACEFPQGFACIAARVAPSVVNVSTVRQVSGRMPEEYASDPRMRDFFDQLFGEPRNFDQRSLASGVIISKEGYILTNHHVVDKASAIVVKFRDGRESKAKLVGADATSDLAVIKVEGQADWPVADMADSDKIQIGDWVLAIGSPFGLEQTVTAGIISAKGRVIGEGPYDDFLQTDASINPGNSGGPLIDMQGRVVGINTAIFSNSGGSLGIGFAVPINMARKIADDLVKSGKVQRGWLGVVIQPLTEDLAAQFGLKDAHGALISSVAKNGPADKAGLKPGDIILEFNGQALNRTHELPRLVSGLKKGQQATLAYWREGARREVAVTVGDLSEAEGTTAARPRDTQRQAPAETSLLGMAVENLTPENAEQLGTDNRDGVVITNVSPGGLADTAGLQPGDVIREINRRKVRNSGDYQGIVKSLKANSTVLLLIERNGYPIFATIKIAQM